MQKVSLKKTILNDALSFILTIIGPLLLAIAIFADIFGFLPRRHGRGAQSVDPDFIIKMGIIGLILTVVFWMLLGLRIRRIGNIVAHGPRVKAKLLAVDFFKDRGRIEYEYTLHRKQHSSGTGIMKNKQTEALTPGDEIELALDPDDFNKSYYVDLYCDKV